MTIKAMSSIIARLCLIVCFGAAWGCGSRTASQTPSAAPPPVFQPTVPPPAPPAPTEPTAALPSPTAPAAANAFDCALLSGQDATPIATVGLGERADPAHAPYPSNEGERLLFRQLYETLVQMDCAGNPMPGLATFWRLDASRKTWSVALRPDARFSDDTPVTAADVVASWMSSGDGRGNESELRPEVRRLVQSVAAVDDRTLEITLRSQRADAPLPLAHTDLAVAKSVPGSPWPLGTRGARIDPGVAAPASARPSVITLMRLPVNSATVRFLVSSGRDSRDLLDQGVDLLVTRDPTTLGYAATLPQFVTAPLPWRRTHVLLTPARTARTFSPEERKALAQDAVRGEARGAEGPFWWESLSDCEIPSSKTPPQAPSPTRRIIYDADDGAARDLAERACRHRNLSACGRANGRSARSGSAAWERGRLRPVS